MGRVLAARRASGVLAGLTTVFNVLLLNVLVLLACLPIVTSPLALRAGWGALERWRGDGEDRVAREFWSAFVGAGVGRPTAVVGAPLVLLAIGIGEVHYFAARHTPMGLVCLGLGLSSVYLAAGSLGYVLALDRRAPTMAAGEIWSIALRLAVGNAFVTGPLFLLELVAALGVGRLDPATLLLGLPLAFLACVRQTVRLGLRRSGLL